MQYNDTGIKAFPNDVANAVALAAYRRVVLDSSGNLAYAGATQAGFGTLEAQTVGTDVAGSVRFWNTPGTRYMIASGAIAANADVYAAASGKVAATGSVRVGKNVGEASTADGDLVEILPDSAVGQSEFSVAVAAGTALTASSTETALGSYTFPANSLKVGDVIRIKFQGICTATNSTDTFQHKAYIGGLSGTAIATGTATDVADNNIFEGEIELVIRTIGANGTFVSVANHTKVPAASLTASRVSEIVGSTAIDTTVAQQIAISGKWSTTSGSNSARLDILNVQHLPRMAA